MANEILDTVYQNTLQKITSPELNARELLRDATLAYAIGSLCGLRSTTYGGGDSPGLGERAWACLEPGSFNVTDTGALSFGLARGFGICRDDSAAWAAYGRGPYRWLYLEDSQTFSVAATATPGWTRYDIVLIRPSLYLDDYASVDIKNPVTDTYSGAVSPTRYRQALRWGSYAQFQAGDADACVKTGTEALVPVEPSTDTGAIKVYTVRAGNAVASPWFDYRRTPRLPQRASWRVFVEGSLAGAFANDIVNLGQNDGMSPVLSSGIGLIRTGPGVYDAYWTGGTPTSNPSVRITPIITGGGAERVIANISVLPALGRSPAADGSTLIGMKFWDVVGAAAIDCDFLLEIESNDNDGGFGS